MPPVARSGALQVRIAYLLRRLTIHIRIFCAVYYLQVGCFAGGFIRTQNDGKNLPRRGGRRDNSILT